MSKFGSKEEILSAVQLHFENIQSGNLSAEEMESLVELTRELHERALILRYKSYEEKIFGVRPLQAEIEEPLPAQETTSEDAKPEEIIPADKPQAFINFETIEEEILAAEPAFPAEEPIFDFEVFEKAEADESEIATQFNVVAQEATQISPSFSEAASTSPAAEQSEEAKHQSTDLPTKESSHEEIAQHSQNNFQTENTWNPSSENKTETPEVAIEIEETAYQQTSNNAASENADRDARETPKTEYTQEIPLPESLAIMNEPVIVPEKPSEIQVDSSTNEPEIFKNIASNHTQDNSLGSKYTGAKLQTLVGAFGLNEKLQCIRELFKGSSEAFNQAIEKLDQQENFDGAKRILAQYAQQNSWNLEGKLTTDFIQKVERRFA